MQPRLAELGNERLGDAALALGFLLVLARRVEQGGRGVQKRLSLLAGLCCVCC
jgi:hypothetical protein